MKNMFKLPILVIGFLFLIIGTAQKAAAQEEDVSLQTFYDELSPYGTWIQDSQYGYVWRPDVDQGDFRPYYTNGRWVMTEYGNTWVSDYNWGWAPFHYGRWIYNSYNEWVWLPDTTWGPAWVSWRSGGGYYGWAPLSPGINININFGGGYHIPNSWWCFIPQISIYSNSYPRYRSYNNVTIINNTTIINNVYRGGRNTYYTGPGRDDIRRVTNRDVRVYNINRTTRSDRGNITNNTVNIYNPRPSRSNDGRPAAPRNVTPESTYIANRGDRSNRGGNNAVRPVTDNSGRNNGSGTVNRADRGTATTPMPDRGQNTDRNNNNIGNARPSRGGEFNPGRQNTGTINGRPMDPTGTPTTTRPVRTEGTAPSNQNTGRPERVQPQPGQNNGPRNFQPQRWQTRPVQQAQPQGQPQGQPQPQRQERPQQQQPSRPVQQPQQQPQRQPQPQRPAPQPQPQRQERPQQQTTPPRETRSTGDAGSSRSTRGQ